MFQAFIRKSMYITKWQVLWKDPCIQAKARSYFDNKIKFTPLSLTVETAKMSTGHRHFVKSALTKHHQQILKGNL